jgi:Fur family iron response transcriptional regulator
MDDNVSDDLLSGGAEEPLADAGLHPMQSTIAERLRKAGLRPTRQRVTLGVLLFGGEDRHVSAEMLHAEAISAGEHVSLATVYNTLHQFTGAGLLREVAIEGSKTYFDTNTSDHHHFYFEHDGKLMDIEGDMVSVMSVPEPPEGMQISRVDVLVRLVAKPQDQEG